MDHPVYLRDVSSHILYYTRAPINRNYRRFSWNSNFTEKVIARLWMVVKSNITGAHFSRDWVGDSQYHCPQQLSLAELFDN